MGDITGWFDYSFGAGGVPLETPSVAMVLRGDVPVFRASAVAGSDSIRRMDLSFATQMDSTLVTPCDFRSIRMFNSAPITSDSSPWAPQCPAGRQ